MASVRRVPPPRVRATLPLVFVAAVLAACGDSGGTNASTGPVTIEGEGAGSGQASAVGDGSSSRLSAVLSGAAEVPGPGDPDARGRATLVLEPGRSQLCYRIEVQRVSGVDGTFLHEGDDGQEGGVVLGLDSPEGGSIDGCVTAAPALLERVDRSPGEFYLNVHSEEHPDGAVRGQLTATAS
jgi:hypothetical protein